MMQQVIFKMWVVIPFDDADPEEREQVILMRESNPYARIIPNQVVRVYDCNGVTEEDGKTINYQEALSFLQATEQIPTTATLLYGGA